MIQSPCVGVCKLDGMYCRGCLRTIREIGGWSSFNDDERRAVLGQLAQRQVNYDSNGRP